jgi:hypothetical protein
LQVFVEEKMDRGSTLSFRRSTPKSRHSAALAYYAEVTYNGNCNGNPASCYCSQLGGSDLFGGINAAGGGWVKKSDPNDPGARGLHFSRPVDRRFLGIVLSLGRNHPRPRPVEGLALQESLRRLTAGPSAAVLTNSCAARDWAFSSARRAIVSVVRSSIPLAR